LTTGSHSAPHSSPLTAAGRRDTLPRLRLLVGRENGDGVATVCLRLLSHPVEGGSHLLEALTRPRSRGRIRTGARSARPSLRTHRVHLGPQGLASFGRSPRDGGKSCHLRIGESELARMTKEEASRVFGRAAARSPHGTTAGHRSRVPGTRLLLGLQSRGRGASQYDRNDEPLHCLFDLHIGTGPVTSPPMCILSRIDLDR
jgi:hypothetical protein